MPKFRKKPVEIEARQFTEESIEEIAGWCGGRMEGDGHDQPVIIIHTLEGDMTAFVRDWIIEGVQGEFYPCKPDIFDQTYDPVE
jgi:hypothetical protein